MLHCLYHPMSHRMSYSQILFWTSNFLGFFSNPQSERVVVTRVNVEEPNDQCTLAGPCMDEYYCVDKLM